MRLYKLVTSQCTCDLKRVHECHGEALLSDLSSGQTLLRIRGQCFPGPQPVVTPPKEEE